MTVRFPKPKKLGLGDRIEPFPHPFRSTTFGKICSSSGDWYHSNVGLWTCFLMLQVSGFQTIHRISYVNRSYQLKPSFYRNLLRRFSSSLLILILPWLPPVRLLSFCNRHRVCLYIYCDLRVRLSFLLQETQVWCYPKEWVFRQERPPLKWPFFLMK